MRAVPKEVSLLSTPPPKKIHTKYMITCQTNLFNTLTLWGFDFAGSQRHLNQGLTCKPQIFKNYANEICDIPHSGVIMTVAFIE